MQNSPNLKETSTLAQGLQNSNFTEVAALAKGFLALEAAYNELKYRYTKQTAELVMKKHDKVFKALAQIEEE